MKSKRNALLGLVGLLVLAATPLLADTAAYYEPPVDPDSVASRAKLVADRQFGFAPMTVNLSGMLESRDGDLFPIDGEQDVVLTVESPFLHMNSTAGSYHIGTDFRYEATSAGPETPTAYTRSIRLTRPGRYVFKIVVLDQAGEILRSNEVTVRAL